MTNVVAKRYAPVQRHLEFFQKCILAVKTLAIGILFPGGRGGGCHMVFPPFLKSPV